MAQPLFVSSSHALFETLDEPDRQLAHRIAQALQVPPNPNSMSRLLGRAYRGIAHIAGNCADAETGLELANRLLKAWESSANPVSSRYAAFYDVPLDRDPSAANPALGYKSTHPLYAALVASPLPSAEEAIYTEILGAAVALVLKSDAQTPESLKLAQSLAEDARQRAEGALPVFRTLSAAFAGGPNRTSMNPASIAAFTFLRARRLASMPSLTESERLLLRNWLRALEAIGSSATGRGLAPKSRPGQIFTSEIELDNGKAGLILPRRMPIAEASDETDGDADPIVIGPDIPPDILPPSRDQANLQAQRAWAVATRAGALLPLSWHAFTPFEVDVLHEHLAALPDDVGAAIIRAGLACGIRPRAIAAALDQGQHSNGFELKAVSGGFEVVRVLAAVNLTRQFDPHSDPRFVAAGGQVEVRSLLIPISSDRYSDSLDHTLQQLRKDRRLRMSDGRVARTLVMDFITACPDPFVADIALNASTLQGLSGAGYYSAITGEKLADSIEHAKHRHRSQIHASGGLIGSRGVPESETVTSSIRALSALIDDASSTLATPSQLATFHNLFVGYELLLLAHATGHRLVTDPFPFKHCLLHSSHFVIADKASTPSHATRLAVASDIAKEQWARHRKHLLELSYRLAFLRSPDADRIQGVVDGLTPVTAPYFFFLTNDLRLESVTPRSFKERLGQTWTLPLSAHRHFMAYRLREAGCPAELIHIHLGHWIRGNAPFGPTSLLRPPQLVQLLSPSIDRTLTSIGLIPKDGLPVAGVYRRHASEVYDPAPCAPLGPANRADARKPSQKILDIEEILAASCWNFGIDIASSQPTSIPRDSVVNARNVLLGQFDADTEATKSALRRLRRVCIGLRSKGWGIWIPGAPYCPDDARPVLADYSGRSAWAGREIRVTFQNWLAENLNELPPADLHAATLLSAALIGGLLRESHWSRLLSALSEGAWNAESVDWIELGRSGSSGYRYIGDATTRGMIRRAARVKPDSQPDQLLVRANELLRSICKHIKRPDPASGPHGPSHRIDSLKQALPCLIDCYATEVSGLALAHMRGSIASYSTTPTHFVRLLSGKRLAGSTPDGDVAVDAVVDELATRKTVSAADSGRQIQEFSSILQKAQAYSDAAAGTDIKRRRRHRRRADLLLELGALLSRLEQTGCSSPLLRMVRYAYHLTKHGGIQEKKLAPRTIQEYAGVGVQEIVKAFGQHDPAELDGDERTIIYKRLLMRSESPTGWAKRLRYFDFYLHAECDADPADWRILAPGESAPLGGTFDYPTLQDTLRLDVIASGLEGKDPLDSATAASIRLISRSGIRSGEAYRLETHDLAPPPGAYLRIVNNASGEVKTTSGIRRAALLSLPLVADMDPLLIGRNHGNGTSASASGALFNGGMDSSPGATRSRLLQRLKAAVALATGNPLSRPHHCRHAAASNAVLLAANLPNPLVLKALGNISIEGYEHLHSTLRGQLTGRQSITTLWSIAIPQTLGHAEFATSIQHYVHVVDILVAAEIDSSTDEAPPTLAAALLEISPNALYQARDRAKRRGDPTTFHNLLLARRSHPSAPRAEAFPELTHFLPRLAPAKRSDLKHASLPQLAAMVASVFSGSSIPEVAEAHDAQFEEVKALFDAVGDMQIFFGGKVSELQSERAENTTLLAERVAKACAMLRRADRKDPWDSSSMAQHAGRLLGCWRPSQRHFDCLNTLAESAVEAWLEHAELEPQKAARPLGTTVAIKGLKANDGARLSAVILTAYFCELRTRLRGGQGST